MLQRLCQSALPGLIAVLLAAPALAQTAIGNATKINPSVTGAAGGRASQMATGDGVVQNETVQTGASGEARLRFLDNTDLSVGPGSNIKLDRFVFDGAATASSVVMSTARGAFRFTTGNSAHEAYRINTPAAAIGVRGTQFSFSVRNGRLSLDVLQGVVIVCPRGKSRNFCIEAVPGQHVEARAGAPAQVFASGGGPPDEPPRGNPLGALPGIGLQLGIPFIFGHGMGGGGGGGKPPCLTRYCR